MIDVVYDTKTKIWHCRKIRRHHL